MKPNFALSLSFEGIRLLHRAAGGWRIVGDVGLDTADLAAELATLRRTATALDPSDLRTKLLLPNAQIKYLTIDTPDMDTDARMDAARAALDGATPYAVADLAFDISADGDKTHVAAVAKETLAEAEGFAAEHHFNPISFAAIPDDTPYLGEPFFGPAAAAQADLKDGEEIEPDGIAVVIIGDVDGNDTPVAEPQEEITTPQAEDTPEPAPASEKALLPPQDEAQPKKADEATASALSAKTDAKPVKKEKPGQAEDTTENGPEPAKTDSATPVEGPAKKEAKPEKTEKAADKTAAEDAPTETPPQADKSEIPAPPVFKTRAVIDDTPPDETPQTSRAPDAQTAFELEAPEPQVSSKETSKAPEPAASEPEASEPATAKAAAAETEDKPVKKSAPMMPALGPASRAADAPKVRPGATPDGGFASRRKEGKAAPAPRVEPSLKAPAPAKAPEENAAPVPVASPAPEAANPPPAPIAADRAEPSAIAATAAASMAAATAAAAPIGRFLSRRKTERAAAAAAPPAAQQPAMAAAMTAPQDEAERMTVFGARRTDVGGKPRFLGLILTAALLVFLAGVAAWASVFLDDGLNLSRLFGDRTARETVQAAPETTDPAPVITASLDPTLTPEDTAVLDALRAPVQPQTKAMTQRELEALYAATGIWPQAPAVPPEPVGLVNIDDLYVTSIDPVSTSNDAVALPVVASFGTDLPLGTLTSPAAAGTAFALDARGLIIPTAAGAISPNGFTVFLGRPPLEPPATLTRFQAVPQDDPATTALAAFRPKNRPSDLAETNERASLGGVTLSELARARPNLRPRSIQQQAQAAAEKAAAEKAAEEAKQAAAAAEQDAPDTDTAVETALAASANAFKDATRLATKASARPDTRPRNFSRIVRRAQRTPQPETRVASAQVAPRVVTPKVPTKTSVARQATVKNAINLRRVNLIGVYGKPSNRRALVRLGNGRYKKVTVGDRIDGGRISAISNTELRYSKGGRSVVLKMP